MARRKIAVVFSMPLGGQGPIGTRQDLTLDKSLADFAVPSLVSRNRRGRKMGPRRSSCRCPACPELVEWVWLPRSGCRLDRLMPPREKSRWFGREFRSRTLLWKSAGSTDSTR